MTASSEKSKTAAAKPSVAQELIDLASNECYFEGPNGRAYATVQLEEYGDRRFTVPLKSSRYKNWLANLYFAATGNVASSHAKTDAISILTAWALDNGERREVFVRVGHDDKASYLDLANEKYQAVELTTQPKPNDWQVIPVSPVPFVRGAGLALPLPDRHGSLDALRRFVNVSDDQWRLIVAWLLMTFRPRGPYPILCLHGEQGCGKSVTSRLLQRLIDPSQAGVRAAPRDTRDLAIACGNSWLLAYDNLSRLEDWLSDALCRVSTGGGFATRGLYTDDEEVIIRACRPVLLNGINEVATASDLADRCIVLQLSRFQDDVTRRTEEEIYAEFEKAWPQLFGALLTAAGAALREWPAVTEPAWTRMADFARWGTAVERALDWPAGSFRNAYQANRAEANELTLANWPPMPALRDLVASEPEGWTGEAQQLLDRLTEGAGYQSSKETPRQWPQSARTLAGQLRRLAPNLRTAGIQAIEPSGSHKKGRLWWVGPTAVPKSGVHRPHRPPSSPVPHGGPRSGDAGDDGDDAPPPSSLWGTFDDGNPLPPPGND